MGRDDVVLGEADSRKAAFLREAARITETKVTIEACRIEALRPIRAGIVTARALAPVADLLHYARAFADESTLYLLLKGGRVEDALTTAKQSWNMRHGRVPSLRSEARREGKACVRVMSHRW